jgi:nucleotide-binding universal stress UspA family protein
MAQSKKNMKTIVVPTDFSPVSLNAVDFAAHMAKAIDADIRLFHVYNIPVGYTEVPMLLVSPEELKFSAELQLEAVKQKVVGITGGKVTVVADARMGDTMDELETYCKRVKPFAVVMGTTGKTGLEKVIFGSTALAAVRHLTWPVLCVPGNKQFGDGIKKIGLACDFREVATTIPAALIKDIVATFKAELHILNVDYVQRHFKPTTPLETHHLHILFKDIEPRYHYIDYPDIEEGIDFFARANKLDLVIAIPKKHKLLEGIFKPSSTKQLIFQSHVPVMCVHE